MPADETTEIVQAVGSEFGLRSPTVQLLESIDHCNSKIAAQSGSYFLKILASGYSQDHLRSRLQFEDFLRAGDLPIPATVESTSGRRFAKVRLAGVERLGILSRWVDGELLGERREADLIERCGELLARLHARSQAFEPPQDFQARAWDEVYAPPPAGWLRTFLANSPLNEEARQVVERAAARMRAVDASVSREPRNYGLLHADFHGDNLIFDGQTIWIVDLDDIGWGHFVFDLTWPSMLFAKHHPDENAYLEPLLRGYEGIRPLGPADRELLAEGHIAAGIGGLEMIDTSPIANDAPLAIEWLDFIVSWLRRHLDQLGAARRRS